MPSPIRQFVVRCYAMPPTIASGSLCAHPVTAWLPVWLRPALFPGFSHPGRPRYRGGSPGHLAGIDGLRAAARRAAKEGTPPSIGTVALSIPARKTNPLHPICSITLGKNQPFTWLSGFQYALIFTAVCKYPGKPFSVVFPPGTCILHPIRDLLART